MSGLRWCLAFLIPLLIGVEAAPAGAPGPLAFTHVTVIDATGASAKPDMTVVISGGRITAIGSSTRERIPKDAQVIEAAGKYVIPGLWDMHVHWGDTEYLPLFLANGVTGIRIMWGGAQQQDWRRQSEAGKLLAPHLVIASEIIDGPKPFWPGSIGVANEVQARQAVVQAKQEGADFVKVYSFLPGKSISRLLTSRKSWASLSRAIFRLRSRPKRPPMLVRNPLSICSAFCRRAQRGVMNLRKRPTRTSSMRWPPNGRCFGVST